MTRFASKYPVTSGAAMSYATHPSAPCPESSCLPLGGRGGVSQSCGDLGLVQVSMHWPPLQGGPP